LATHRCHPEERHRAGAQQLRCRLWSPRPFSLPVCRAAVHSSRVESNDHGVDGVDPTRVTASIAGRGDPMRALGAWSGTIPIDGLVLGVYVSCDALLGHQLLKETTYAKNL
jgi:hypothetical protein